ncbi:hypothetical protein RFI_09869 [Reticulomyxa filosa]|uniref:Uncharacterized protein n=1 Tax=Reticulomyxa filosa TaxID=46433 RepID=X6NMV2_RETFI|nr:hypothetical protein RFI_09869 [Reticulomyxa filosa]|eukprot:ETO27263.1 hypothetical protein RFI_09869 [Reticulomyxa filosa]
MEEEIAQVEKQIVRSPQKIRDNIEKKNLRYQQFEKELQEFSNTLKVYDYRLDEYGETAKSFESIFKFALVIAPRAEELNQLQELRNEMNETRVERERDLARLKKETTSLMVEMKRVNQRLSAAKQELEKRQGQVAQTRREAEGKLEVVRNKQQHNKDSLSKLQEELKTIEDDIDSKKKHFLQQLEQISSKMEHLTQKHANFCQNVVCTLDGNKRTV